MKKFILYIFLGALVIIFPSYSFAQQSLDVMGGGGQQSKSTSSAPKCGQGEVYKPEIGCISNIKPKCAQNEVQVDEWCFPNDPIGFSLKFYNYGLGAIGGLALLVLIVGGYTVLTSQGDPRRLNVGKSYIIYAVSGLLLAVFGLLFFETIVVDILKIPGIKH